MEASFPREAGYRPQTSLGKRLWELRQRMLQDPRVELLDWDGVAHELAERRGENEG
jgi:hypothetical protein